MLEEGAGMGRPGGSGTDHMTLGCGFSNSLAALRARRTSV